MSHGPHVELPTPPQPSYPGLFIAFEGGEGAGKSTQVQALGQHLRAAGVRSVETGGTPARDRTAPAVPAAPRTASIHGVTLPHRPGGTPPAGQGAPGDDPGGARADQDGTPDRGPGGALGSEPDGAPGPAPGRTPDRGPDVTLPHRPDSTPDRGPDVMLAHGPGTTPEREVVLTREPGGTPAAEAIREVVLHPRFAGLDARAEALLFAAARGEHVREVVMPALQRSAIVVSDRYLDSSIAYQGIARGLGRDLIEGLSLWAAGGLVPDLTVVLDVDERTGLGRVADPDRLESESVEFHRLVRRAFLGLAARAAHRYLVIDAGLDRAAIAAQVAQRVDALLASRATAPSAPATAAPVGHTTSGEPA